MHVLSISAIVFIVGLSNVFTSAVDAAEVEGLDPLVSVEAGELPIILSAPHGGLYPVPGVTPRQGSESRAFNPLPDLGTARLTTALAGEIERLMGKRPYTVIAKFHRKYIDANRGKTRAYESEAAQKTYEDYHRAIADARHAVIERWGHGMLFDIHGQSAEPLAIIRGTVNGSTTKHLVGRFGLGALIGGDGLFGRIASQGLTVIPAVDSMDTEHPAYNGGFIVNTYGSRNGGTIDAVQLEIGTQLRLKAGRTETAKKLANSVAQFAKDYLPKDGAIAIVESNNHQKTGFFVGTNLKNSNTIGGITNSRNNVRIGVYVDEGAGPSVNDLLRVLSNLEGATVTHLNADEIRSGKLAVLDLLMLPGGSGGGQGRRLGEDGRNAIRGFVKMGGGFVGICAGAYVASSDYSWSLNILDAKVVDREHWNRGRGPVEIVMTDAGGRLLGSENQKLWIYYAQGPLLAPGNRPDIEDYETIATFDSEIAKNGAPQGVMVGTTAIAKGKFGSGRVICFSPHPEMTNGLEEMVRLAIDHVKREDEKD